MSEHARGRFRFRWLAKWAGTLVCAALALLLIASGWVCAAGPTAIEYGGYDLIWGLHSGVLWYGAQDKQQCAQSLFVASAMVEVLHPPNYVWWPDEFIHHPAVGNFQWFVECPIWVALLAGLVPTVCLWASDRRGPLPGNCKKCNYNLTGNASGVCPECGTPIAAGPGSTP